MGIHTCSGSLRVFPWSPEHRQQKGDWRPKANRVRWQLIIPSLLKDSLLPVNVKVELSSGALDYGEGVFSGVFALSKQADAVKENGRVSEGQGLSIAEAKNSTAWRTAQHGGTTLPTRAASYSPCFFLLESSSQHVSNSASFLTQVGVLSFFLTNSLFPPKYNSGEINMWVGDLEMRPSWPWDMK